MACSNLAGVAIASRFLAPEVFPERRDIESKSGQGKGWHLQTDHPGGVDAGEDPLRLGVDHNDLAAWHGADRRVDGGELNAAQPVQLPCPTGLPGAIGTAGVVVQGDTHRDASSTLRFPGRCYGTPVLGRICRQGRLCGCLGPAVAAAVGEGDRLDALVGAQVE